MTPEQLLNRSSGNISHYYDTRIFNIRIEIQAITCNLVSGIYVVILNDDSIKVIIHNGIIIQINICYQKTDFKMRLT